MKPNQLAALLNISPVTLRQWASNDYREFLSPAGQGSNGARRAYDDQDARILAWVASMRAENVPAKEILSTLRAAQANGWQDLPMLRSPAETVDMVPRQAVEERFHAINEKYSLVVRERDELIRKLATAQDEKETLQQRITDLSAEAAELRGLMAQYTFGGRRANVAVLVTGALLVGMALMLIIVWLVSTR